MHCPRLSELPPPPPGCTGWPWTVETPPLPATAPGRIPWPTISIVTPSFNQGVYLEETIRSILLQGYPKLEHIVIDGGSTDDSVAIIKKYERWLTYWVSERDHGQAHAINKGLAHCTGAIFNWINSDDYLLSGALGKIAAAFHEVDAVAGTVLNFDETGWRECLVPGMLVAEKLASYDSSTRWHQPGLWFHRESVTASGGIDESYHYSFDWDLAIRYLSLFPRVNRIPDVLVHFRLHPQSKTTSSWDRFMEERYRILQKLSTTAVHRGVRKASWRQVRSLEWYDVIASVRNDRQRSRFLRSFKLAMAACLDPEIRFTRFTLGAIRQLLFPSPPARNRM
jgi:glycosyltransferase involved in cell wall biosynthesis